MTSDPVVALQFILGSAGITAMIKQTADGGAMDFYDSNSPLQMPPKAIGSLPIATFLKAMRRI